MDGWVWVSLRFATFALLVENDVVVDAAPIADYAVGWGAHRAVAYFRGRRADVRCFPVRIESAR
jgi:hypothetical protein